MAFEIAKKIRGGNQVGWTTYSALSNLVYPLFEKKLWKQFRTQLEGGAFDLVHRVTPLSPTSSSWLAPRLARMGVPYVLGPINGGVPWPQGFGNVRRKEKEWLSYLRGLYPLLPGIRSTRRHASALVLASRHTFQEVAKTSALRDKAVYIPENAIDPARFPGLASPPEPLTEDRPMRAAFVGRLVPYKGADLLIEAAAPMVRAGRLEIDIIGDGEQMPLLRSAVETQGITRGVHLHGWIPHERLHARLSQSQIFAFPSVREFGGGVVLEAMALGLMPLVMDYAGPAELVPEGCGRRISIGSRESIIRDFREALETCLNDRRGTRETGTRAQSFVRARFTWQAKARQMKEVYDWVLNSACDKPDWGMPFAASQVDDLR
jgi:glycosyltransferase involved in cell wall biosynthesis